VSLLDDPAASRAQLRSEAERLREENARLRRERDLAVAHDTQPYPTADAYEKVCAVLREREIEVERLRAVVERMGDLVAEWQKVARA
jgi:hypothetical protein